MLHYGKPIIDLKKLIAFKYYLIKLLKKYKLLYKDNKIKRVDEEGDMRLWYKYIEKKFSNKARNLIQKEKKISITAKNCKYNVL